MKCLCGKNIEETETPNRRAAELIGEKRQEIAEKEFSRLLARYLEASKTSQLPHVLREIFSAYYPLDGNEVEVINDIRDKAFSSHWKKILECLNCGRLWIETDPGIGLFESYINEKVKNKSHTDY